MSSINPSILPQLGIIGLCNIIDPHVSDTKLRSCLSTVTRTSGKSHRIELASKYPAPKTLLSPSAGNQLCVALSAPAADSDLPINVLIVDTAFTINVVKKALVTAPKIFCC